jgi:hypothetical protein
MFNADDSSSIIGFAINQTVENNEGSGCFYFVDSLNFNTMGKYR